MKFCLVGTGRCGSTLLRQVLHRHPGLYVFDETHWVPQMVERFESRTTPTDRLIDLVARTRHVTGTSVCSLTRSELGEIFEGHLELTVVEFCNHLGTTLAEREDKAAWGDKTPDYGGYLTLLHDLWPQCTFVHLLRDGVATVASMSAHPGYQWLAAAGETWWCPASLDAVASTPPSDTPIAEFAALWRRRLEEIRRAAAALPAGQFIELRYEDLLRSPMPTLASLCGSLGITCASAWLDEAARAVDATPLSRPLREDVLAGFGPAERRLWEDTRFHGATD